MKKMVSTIISIEETNITAESAVERTLYSGEMGSDTLILMSDQIAKPIRDIRLGDLALTSEGLAAQIVNIYSGIEEFLYELTTESEKKVLGTKYLPICTMAGFKKMDELRIGENVSTLDGFEKITNLTMFIYNNRVFELEFQEETIYYRNGIAVGCFSIQNRLERDRG